jgi:peptidoglycan/LPS O-acetylase OafA/YrhL/lysophospholipase L1-like esterase
VTTTLRASAPPRLGYQPGLDGLRAVSVAAVVLYHADIPWMPGGFLGVEVFFVISGFLITTLLLEERERNGAVSMRGFWTRRAKRLLPALYLLLAVVSVASLLVYRDAAGRMGGDVIAALLYVSNWWQIHLDQSYFAQAGRPPLLQHLWSLAIEEQFYLLFPPLFVLAVARFAHRNVRWFLIACSVASAVYMAILFTPFEDPSGAYYNTFARASGLLLGAVLAMVWAPWRERRRTGPGAVAAMNVTGVLGLALIVWFLTRVNAFDSFIYRGGFFLLDLVCVAVIAVLVHPSAWLGRVLGVPPLQWLGLRSYSIYLWHWPIFMVTRPGIDVPFDGWPLFVLRIALTMAAAEASYRYVELPIRHGALGRWWDDLRQGQGERRAFALRQGAVIGGIGLSLTVLIAWGLQQAASDPARDELALEATGLADEVALAGPPTDDPAVATTTTILSASSAELNRQIDQSVAAGRGAAVRQTPTNALLVGDSVVLGAKQELQNAMPGIRVDAAVSRQFDGVLEVVGSYAEAGEIPGPLVVNAGVNGTFTDDDLDELFELAGEQTVLLVNAKVDRPWEDLVNGRLDAAAERHPTAVLVDWYSVGEEHPEWFTYDGSHLNPEGARAFAELIRDRLARITGAPTIEPSPAGGTGAPSSGEADGPAGSGESTAGRSGDSGASTGTG